MAFIHVMACVLANGAQCGGISVFRRLLTLDFMIRLHFECLVFGMGAWIVGIMKLTEVMSYEEHEL